MGAISATSIKVSGAPEIPGLSFRRFTDDRDHAHLLEITNRCWAADAVGHLQSLLSIANSYRSTAGFEPKRDVVFAEIDGNPAAFSRITHARQEDGIRIYDVAGQVLPQWRRRGLGAALLRNAVARQRERAWRHPADSPKLLQSSVFDGQVGARSLLEEHGFTQTPELELQDMVRPTVDDFPFAALPPELVLRPAQPEHMRQIWALFRGASSDGLGALEAGEDDYQRWASWPFWDLSLWQIAWDGQRPAGMVLNFIRADENAHFGRRRGYTEFINVAREWRRRGVARALIVRSLAVLKERGMLEAALDVYVHNPTGARQLYESFGYRKVRSLSCYRRQL